MPHFDVERDILIRQITNRLEEIEVTIYSDHVAIENWETAIAPTESFAPPEEGWESFAVDSDWGGHGSMQWMRGRATVSEQMAGMTVVALLEPGAESISYVDGVVAQGLDGNRSEVLLTTEAEAGRSYQIMVGGVGRMAGLPTHYPSGNPMPGASAVHNLSGASIAQRNDLVRSFWWDLKVAMELFEVQPAGSQHKVRLLDHIDRSIKLVDLNGIDDLEAYRANVAEAQEKFREGMKDFSGSVGMGHMTLIGHSHIDTAWLWPILVTKHKCARTFSTVLRYMDEYPDYKFSQSQPQLYEYMKDHYPDIYEKIKERVKEGRWEPIGAAWVEQDLNVPSGESHVRQYLYGNRFFRKEFGIHTRVVWLPDCFGFTFALPQIMKKAQIDGFCTTKLHGNQYTQHPYNLFRWRGLDGSEVMSWWFPTLCNGHPAATDLAKAWNGFGQKEICDEIPYSFGHGDGGGGPTKEMIERGQRAGDLVGVPKTDFGLLEDSFDKLRNDVAWDDMPVFHDEMYYEFHRGCQTTQARTKRNNRKGEILLRDAEAYSVAAMLEGTEYPSDELYSAWKLLMLNQFHDILPGSSIAEVYEDADRDYKTMFDTGIDVRDRALAALGDAVDSRGDGQAVLVANSLGWVRNDVAEIEIDESSTDEAAVLDPAGKSVPSQIVTGSDGDQKLIFETNDVPSTGHAVYRVAKSDEVAVGNAPTAAMCSDKASACMENDFFSMCIDRDGAIERLFDKRVGRDVLPKNAKANDLQLFDDRPGTPDAWNIGFNYEENCRPMGVVASMSVTENGPVRATVRIVRKTDKSTLTQDVSIWRSIGRIDFVTSVDWHERRTMLKSAFPVDVLSRKATYEIQYGAIERATHHSTPHDRARYEVTGHRWIDLSEGDYGVSLLNDCKYGFDTYQNTMRITLLRSTEKPDPNADQGHHDFTYSLYPHADGWQEAETVRRAHELNAPLAARAVDSHSGNLPAVASFAVADKLSVVIDCIKKAEDSSNIIVRVYEAHGSRGPVALTLGITPKSVVECDLMEENDESVDLHGSVISFDIKPWEIRTFKIET
jgi:alpha-mannosidase